MKDKILVPLFFVMTLIWLGPLEIFATNSYEFSFALKDYWWAVVFFGILVFLSLVLILRFLPSKLSRFAKICIFAATLCCYIQTMFFNGHMQTFNNREITWDIRLKILNLLIWLLVFVTVCVALLKAKNGDKCEDYAALFLSAIQFIALISLLVTTDIVSEDKNGYLSTKNMNVLSDKKNVIVFILDYYDGTYVEESFARRPDLIEGLDGFVYYPNATSVHSRTYPSLPYLFSGEICYFDKEPKEYIKEAYDKWNLFDELSISGIDVGYYGYDYFLSDSVKNKITNYERQSLKLRYAKVCKYMLKMALYRDMPYMIKARFKYDIDDINDSVRIDDTQENKEGISDKAFKVSNDTWFGETITSNPLSKSGDMNASFRFYHLGGCHRDLSHPIEMGIESFEIVEEYLRQMKDLGLYEDSTIIIMADHGKSGGGEISESLPHETAVPLMMVKMAGDADIPMRTSDNPVSHADYIPTVCDAFNIDIEDGIPIYEVENKLRERYYYYTAFETDEDGEVLLQEYKVDGDARVPESYTYTGNSWDVRYSLNRVANR